MKVDHEEESGAVQRPLDKVLEAKVRQADLKFPRIRKLRMARLNILQRRAATLEKNSYIERVKPTIKHIKCEWNHCDTFSEQDCTQVII